MISRKKLRDLTMKIVFQYDFYPNPELDEQTKLFLDQQGEEDEEAEDPVKALEEAAAEAEDETAAKKVFLTEKDKDMILNRSKDIFTKMSGIDEMIEASSEGWKLSRMSRLDLSIIRLAVYEMKYDEQVPVKVAINEAVELAKEYGGEESPKFVNGILAKIVKAGNADGSITE